MLLVSKETKSIYVLLQDATVGILMGFFGGLGYKFFTLLLTFLNVQQLPRP